ncbi:MAG: hypothetical protein ACE5G9_02640 [Nitrospinales bacterium]
MKKILPLVVFVFFLFPAIALAGKNVKCNPPYNPTNIFKIIFFYKKTLSYITNAPFSCQQPFAMKVEQIVRSTMLFSDRCVQVTLRDLEQARARRYSRKTS